MSSFTKFFNNNNTVNKDDTDNKNTTQYSKDINSSNQIEEKHVEVLGVGLDTSGSMKGILKTVVDEGKGVIDALNPEKIVFCEFSSHFECYTSDKEKAKERMDLVEASGGTAMYDGVTTMLKELIEISAQGKKVMVLIITDGYENSSIKYTKKDLEDSKTKLREIAGDDCIREICIGFNLQEANTLMKLTPGLSRDTSIPVSRDPKLLSTAIRSMSNPIAPPNKFDNSEEEQEDREGDEIPLPLTKLRKI